jgi:hypothetical protein
VAQARPSVAVKGFMGNHQADNEKERQVKVFELNRGKAVDTLIKDYQKFREAHEMDFSIFSDSVMLVDTQVGSFFALILRKSL